MSASVRTKLAADPEQDVLTAGDLKDWLEHIPDAAVIGDADGDPISSLHAAWEVTAR